MFKRIAVVNRGEAAVRLIRAVRELNEQHDYGIRTIALHTEAERGATFVRQADEAVCLRNGGPAATPYLDHKELERALRESRADAAWVGWGFVAEDPAFAELCERLGVVFIGPSPDVMRRLGDKIEAKLVAERVGVPVAPWSGAPVLKIDDAQRHAQSIGYPLIVKARSGGGGRGIRMVKSADELEQAIEGAQADGSRYFGDPVVFLERLVTGGRHVEVQIIADSHGTVWAPGVRDCSVQRRNQKLIEESSSPVLTDEQAAGLRSAASALVREVGYCGAGTVEFLYEPATKTFAFLEVNTRLQVEHPVTEVTTGIDLVKLQLFVAAGGRLTGDAPVEFGHAIEARLNAEDPDRGFAAAPGAVQLMAVPSGPGVRVDTGFAAGDVIPSEYDSMIAKVIAWGHDRAEALARLRRALRETTVVLHGGATNKSFLLDLVGRPEVVSGAADTGWLDRLGADAVPTPAHADVALLAAAVDVYEAEESIEREAFFVAARGGRPETNHTVGRNVELRYQGEPYRLSVAQIGPHRYRVRVDGGVVDVDVERLGEFQSRLVVGGRRFNVVTAAGPADHLVEVDGVSHRIARDEAGVVRAPAPAVVVALRVAPGDEVEAGATVAVLEAMKMETTVAAPVAGRVREVLAAVNSQVPAGAPLLRLDPESDDVAATGSPAVAFDVAPADADTDARSRALEILGSLRALVTGYDVSEKEARALVADYVDARAQLLADDVDLLQGELDLFTAFADVCELSRNRPSGEEEAARERAHSPREYLHSYLRSLDLEREGLPDAFRAKLSRALRHYAVEDLEPSAALKEAVHRVFLAQQRAGSQIAVVAALLERWLSDGEAYTAAAGQEELGEVLERLVVATQLRFPALGDLARSVRFRLFDQPLLRRARAKGYAGVREHLRYLDQHPDAADRPERIAAMVASPEPLVRLLSQRIGRDGADLGPLLEVLTRRYYRTRGLEDLRSFRVDGRPFVTTEYDLEEQRLRLVSTVADFSELAEVAETAAEAARDVSSDLVIDVYLSWSEPPADTDAMATALRDVLTEVSLPDTIRRVTVSVGARSGAALHHHFTFRPAPGGLEEERLIRGLHPLIAQRLELQRLQNFDVTRLPSSDEDVYLFRCVAPENPTDERFVAMAQVRDLTPLRDAAGQVIALPAAEGVVAACLDGIRRVQAQRPAKGRLDTNRIFIYAWPPSELSVEDLNGIAQRVVPTTVGAGLEEVMFLGRQRDLGTGELHDVAVRISYQPGAGVRVAVTGPCAEPIPPLDEYAQKVRRARARGTVYPYELVPMLSGPDGTFSEHDLDASGRLVPVDRPYGLNSAGIVAGVVRTPTARYPEGMTRVVLMGDPTKALGSVAEPECARVVAAIDLAEEMGVPVEWFALSSGAKISMDSGTENMDWVARALRRIITFTQAGGEINVVVAGINVGAQPYWNAEATMLMHTRGILVMTPDSAMVLTGKQSLDYSGGVSAEDNFGIGGYDRVMGPNGQAQYWAPNLRAACDILFAHYEHAFVAPGERFPRPAITSDPHDRDVRAFPHEHPASDFRTVGEIFSDETNRERKKPFDIRTVMRAVVDQDHAVLERWADMADADTAVVFDAHLGGHAVTVLGVESRPLPRLGALPADGPDQWTAGTLFPRSSAKTARAVNAASGNRPLVVLANLSGFDGSPESLRSLQLEYGAEIGRAIVNFDGPIVFCLISRYHGGAFVVFSGALNDNMEVVAVEGSYASVIGGAPAAAVVFSGEVKRRTAADPRLRELEAALASADDAQQAHLRVELAELQATVRSEKLGEVAAEFEGIHNIERAQKVGSVHTIIPARELRPYLIGAVERGIQRATLV
jgi:acetyl/propionyl-CoA carboxylase alpha subunit/acetyl-CoA carboxylase carboxyltransferase component